MKRGFSLVILVIIVLALILTSCYPLKETQKGTLTLKEYKLEKEDLNARLIFQGDEVRTSGVKITAVFNLKDSNGNVVIIPEELMNSIKNVLSLNRAFKEASPVNFTVRIDNYGKDLVIEAIDDLRNLSLDSATVISYSITAKNEEIRLKDGTVKIEGEDGVVAEGYVLYVKKPLVVKDMFTESGYKISIENFEQLKDFSVYVYFEKLDGSIVKEEEISDGKFSVGYDKISFDEDYKIRIKISYKDREMQIIEKLLSTRMKNTVSIVSKRDDTDPEKVTISFNMPHQEVLEYSKVSYEVSDEDGNSVINKTEVEDAKNIIISGLPNDKLYKIKLSVGFPNGEEKTFEGTIRMHITKIPKLELELDTVSNSKSQSSLIQGIKIRTEDIDEIEKYLGTPGKDYNVSLKFYIKNGDDFIFNKPLTDFYNSLNASDTSFSLKYGEDFYIRYDDIKDSPNKLAEIISSIKGKKIKIVASVDKADGRWVDTFDNPEAFTNIESGEIGPVQTIIFTQYVSGVVSKVKSNTAEITLPQSVLDEIYKNALRKDILIVLDETLTDKWGYYVYDLQNNTKELEEYNGIDVKVTVNKDESNNVKIDITYNEENRELKVYYLFDNGLNIEYDDWKSSKNLLMLKTLVQKYSAYIGSSIRKKAYKINEKTFEDYFNGPIELNPNEVLFTRNDVYWSGSGYALSEAINDGAVVKVIISASNDDGEIDSYEAGVGTSRFKISNLEPGMRYKMKVQFLSSDNDFIGKVESTKEYYKYMMLPVPNFYITEIKKDLDAKTFDATLTISYPDATKYGVTDFYIVIVNKSDGNYKVLEMPATENVTVLTNLDLDKIRKITVIPWIKGKYDYLKEVTGAAENNITSYIEKHIAEAILNDNEGNARKFYYKTIIDSDALPIKKLYVRNVVANGLDVTVTPKLYLDGEDLAMKIYVDIKDPNGSIQSEVSNYQTVVLVKDIEEKTLEATKNEYAEEKEVVIDMGKVKDLSSDRLSVEVYPKYEVAGSEKEGDKFITYIEKPKEIEWPDISVLPDTTYRESDAGILVGIDVPKDQKFEITVNITDETTKKLSEWSFVVDEGESKVSTGNLLHGSDYEVSVKAKSLLYESYKWESDEDKKAYIEKDYGSFNVRTIPYINPVEFEDNLTADMGIRYAFVYLNPDIVLTREIPLYLRVNKSYSDSSIKDLLKEIAVEYSKDPVNSGLLSNPKDGAVWNEDELENLYKVGTDDKSEKAIENLAPGTNYNLRVKTSLKFTTTVLYSTIKSVTTKNYLDNPEANEIRIEKENGNFYIVIKNYKKYTEANGIDPTKNFYRWKIYNEKGELLFPEEDEEDSMVSVKELSSSYIVEKDDTTLKIRLEILNRYARYEKIYVNFFTYCNDPMLSGDSNVGSEMQQELRGWGFVVEEGEVKGGPKAPFNPYQ